jgi:hypothetical protein
MVGNDMIWLGMPHAEGSAVVPQFSIFVLERFPVTCPFSNTQSFDAGMQWPTCLKTLMTV